MNLHDRDDRVVAAGEYVLGLLAPDERRQVEDAATADAALRDEIRGWERRLAPLGTALAAVAPRPVLWLNLLHAIRRGVRATAPAPARFARRWAALATAASLVLGFALYRQLAAPPATVVVTEPVAAEAYVASLTASGAGSWIVSFVPGSQQLRVRAVGASGIGAQNDAELWLLTDAGPVSLGLLPKSGELARALPAGLPPARGRSLAVSLEPAGGSKQRGPSGPVLTSAPLLQVS